jgi:hypothetical protein
MFSCSKNNYLHHKLVTRESLNLRFYFFNLALTVFVPHLKKCRTKRWLWSDAETWVPIIWRDFLLIIRRTKTSILKLIIFVDLLVFSLILLWQGLFELWLLRQLVGISVLRIKNLNFYSCSFYVNVSFFNQIMS